MNYIEPLLLTELKEADYGSLIRHRVRNILMICSHYDAFILEEDGQIETQIYNEYIELGLTSPPRFIWVTTSAEARKVLDEDKQSIDMVISMFNILFMFIILESMMLI